MSTMDPQQPQDVTSPNSEPTQTPSATPETPPANTQFETQPVPQLSSDASSPEDAQLSTEAVSQPVDPVPAVPPITPAEPAAPMQPELPKKGFSKKTILIGLIAIVVLIILAIVGLYILGRHTKSPKGPKLFVGTAPYIYACNVATPDIVTKTLGFTTNKDQQAVSVTEAGDPTDVKDKQIDLLATTGAQSLTSLCSVAVPTAASPSTDLSKDGTTANLAIQLTQFPNASDATKAFDTNKVDETTDKPYAPLPGLPSTSFYMPVQPGDSSDPNSAMYGAFVVHKNALIYISIVQPKGPAIDQYVSKFASLAQAAIQRIDSGVAYQQFDFSGYNTIAHTPFTDICATANYVKIAAAITGGVAFDPTAINMTENYGSTFNSAATPYLQSACGFNFRTALEPAATPAAPSSDDTGSSDTSEFDAKFPHVLLVSVGAFANTSDAQKSLDEAKQTEQGITAISMAGGKGFKSVSSVPDSNGGSGTTQQYGYFLLKDTHLYALEVSFRRQTTPYKTTTQQLSDSQAEQILELLEAQTK